MNKPKEEDYEKQIRELHNEIERLQLENSLLKDTHRKSNQDVIHLNDNLKSFIDTSPMAILITDKNGNYKEANKAATQLTGYSNEELLQLNINDLCPRNVRKFSCPEVSDSNSVVKEDMPFIHKDGSKRYWTVTATPTLDGKILGYHIDTTKRKLTEEELKMREEQLRLAMYSGKQGLYDLNVQTGDADINAQYAEMLGYTLEELNETNDKWRDRLHPDDHEPSSKAYLDYINGEADEYRVEFRQQMKNGKWKWILSVGKILEYDSNGNPLRMLGTHTDIDHSKQTEEALRISEEKHRAMYEQAPLAFQSLDINGHILDINPTWLRTLGYERHEVIGKWFGDFLHKDFVEHFSFNFPRFKAAGHISNVQFHMVKKDGHSIFVSFEGCIGYDEAGNFRQTYCTFKDVTIEHKIKQELIIAKEKAEENDRLKSAFLANMSHEIRTPMNGILGFTSLLKRPQLSPEKQEQYIEIIQKSGSRMLNLINDLIDISKIEANQMTVRYSDVNVNEIMAYLYTFFHPEAKSKGLNFDLVTPTQRVVLKTDKEKLTAILTNLIKNAIKYTEVGGIKWGLEASEELTFFVSDTGIGIPEEKQNQIFERFVQADAEMTKAHEGAGLGLSISKAFVELLGGEISVSSNPEGGSTFVFTLDNYAVHEIAKNDSVSTHNNPTTKLIDNAIIAICEDDYMTEIFMRELFENNCKELIHAKNGEELLLIVEKRDDIDIILLDLKMPVMDGYQAARAIRERNIKTPIVAQTAFALQGDREKALEAGCDDYLSKPLEKNLLFATINKLLAKASVEA